MSDRIRDPVVAGNYPVIDPAGPSVIGTDYDSDMSIGQKIKQRREELRLDIKDVAKSAGMGPTTLYDLERGDQKTTTRLHALCKALGLNPEWVADGRGPRLVQRDQISGDKDANLVKLSDQPADNIDMAHLARDVFEIALLLSTLQEPLRSRIIAMIQAAASQRPEESILPANATPDTVRK